MNKQNRNDQRSPSQNPPKNAGGNDDIEESDRGVEEEGVARQPGGGRHAEGERPGSQDNFPRKS